MFSDFFPEMKLQILGIWLQGGVLHYEVVKWSTLSDLWDGCMAYTTRK